MMIEGLSLDQLPSTWRYLPLGSFCDFSGGTQPPKSTFKEAPAEGYVRLLQIRDFETDRYAVYIPRNNRLRTISAEDISIARYGASVGRILTGKSGAINVAIMTTYPDESQIVKAFLCYALQHRDFQNYLTGLGGRAAQAGFNKGEVSRFKFPLPPVPEQRNIAAVLGLVQRAIEQQERLIALTIELKKALLHKLFTEGLSGEPQKQTEIGPVPESWEETTLGQLAVKPHGFLQTGPFGSQLHKNDYLSQGIGVVNPTHLWGNQINHEEIPRVSKETAERLERHRLEADDILFARRGEIGRHGLVTKEEEGWLCGTGCFLARVRHEHIDNRFLSYLFSTPGVIAWLNSHAAGAIMPNLNNAVLRSMPVFYPKFDVQVEIADCLDACEQKMINHVRKKESFTDLFRTLLHQLMTAQIRVKDIDLSLTAFR
jgi:type I restriction enzyme, S subunit